MGDLFTTMKHYASEEEVETFVDEFQFLVFQMSTDRWWALGKPSELSISVAAGPDSDLPRNHAGSGDADVS